MSEPIHKVHFKMRHPVKCEGKNFKKIKQACSFIIKFRICRDVRKFYQLVKLCLLDFFFYFLMFIFLCFSCINNLFLLCFFRYEQKFYTRSSLLPSPFFYSVVNGREVIFIGGRSQTTLTRFWLFLATYPPTLTFSMV